MGRKYEYVPSIFMTDEELVGHKPLELTDDQRALLCETLRFVCPEVNCDAALAEVTNWVNL